MYLRLVLSFHWKTSLKEREYVRIKRGFLDQVYAILDVERDRGRRDTERPVLIGGSESGIEDHLEVVAGSGRDALRFVQVWQPSFRLGAGDDRIVARCSLCAPIILATRAERALLGLSMA